MKLSDLLLARVDRFEKAGLNVLQATSWTAKIPKIPGAVVPGLVMYDRQYG